MYPIIEERFDFIKNDPEYYFQKALDAWNVWKNTTIDSSLLEELIRMDYEDFRNSDRQEIINLREKIFKLVSYLDIKAKGKNDYNEYEDKRAIARAGIYQNAWVRHLLIYKSDTGENSIGIRHMIDYLENPADNWPILSENHRKKIIEHYIEKTYDPTTFNQDLDAHLSNLWTGVNPLNRTQYLTSLIYNEESQWKDKDSTEKAIGLFSHETNDEWKRDLTDQINDGYACTWWHTLPTRYTDQILSDLRELLDKEDFFYYFYLKNHQAYYRARVRDFATKKNYDVKKTEWKNLNPVWFEENFNDYEDGKHSASIVFLIDEFIQPEEFYYVNQFKRYKDMTYRVNGGGMAAFSKIFSKDQIEDQNKMQDYINQLLNNYNIIFTGAPGTGKTFLAGKIAETLGVTSDRFEMIQFHPSYDYTDFMEGLRPINNENSKEIGFCRKDGVFMEFCRRALKDYKGSNDKKNTPKYIFVIDEINRGEISKIFGELFFSIDPAYRGEKGKIKTQYVNLWAQHELFDEDAEDPKKFYIPENVYIIGTMNDIDRSIDTMDFAMRRRFAFIEVSADSRFIMIKEDEVLKNFANDILKRMKNLNKAIEKQQNLNSSYHIGPAYFLKLKNYLEDDKINENSWKSLWGNHLKGLLKEYLRGIPNSDDRLKDLEEAFNLKVDYLADQQSTE